jgi:hypothetical protein
VEKEHESVEGSHVSSGSEDRAPAALARYRKHCCQVQESPHGHSRQKPRPLGDLSPVFRIRIHRIHMFLGFMDPDPDPLVRGMDPDPTRKKIFDSYCFVTSFFTFYL